MDRAAVSCIAHGELTLYNPLSDADLDAAIAGLDLEPGARVLEVACGRAETLRRIAARWSISGVGYDLDAELIAHGRGATGAGVELMVADQPGAGRRTPTTSRPSAERWAAKHAEDPGAETVRATDTTRTAPIQPAYSVDAWPPATRSS